VKLKATPSTWDKDQVEALKWAGQVFERMGPHAKEDIMKFQEKLERIDRDLDRHNKLMLATHVDFYAIKEEYVALTDKRNAYEQALKGLQEDIRARKQGKQWKLRSLFFAPKAPNDPP
jgi:chromosome segregation ATPase